MATRTALTSTRRRIIYDSELIDAAFTGTKAFFVAPGVKTRLEMWPTLNGKMPDRQRFLIDGISIVFPSSFIQFDAKVLDGAVVTLEVEDGEGQKQKIRGQPRNFPAGGGVAGVAAVGSDGVTVEAFNNGQPSAQAIYTINPPQEVAPNIAFRVDVTVPQALSGITSGLWYVKLTGLWTYFLKQMPRSAEAREKIISAEIMRRINRQRRLSGLGLLLPEEALAG